MIKVRYNKKTGEIIGFYPDSINYKSVSKPYIKISYDRYMELFSKDLIVENNQIRELSNEELQQLNKERQSKYKNSLSYQQKRSLEYPSIGDQLDAILKYFFNKKTKGEELSEDIDQIIKQWISVKEKYPKNT